MKRVVLVYSLKRSVWRNSLVCAYSMYCDITEQHSFFFSLQELFVEMIAKDALVYAQQGKRKTLQRKDLGELKSDLKMKKQFYWKHQPYLSCNYWFLLFWQTMLLKQQMNLLFWKVSESWFYVISCWQNLKTHHSSIGGR